MKLLIKFVVLGILILALAAPAFAQSYSWYTIRLNGLEGGYVADGSGRTVTADFGKPLGDVQFAYLDIQGSIQWGGWGVYDKNGVLLERNGEYTEFIQNLDGYLTDPHFPPGFPEPSSLDDGTAQVGLNLWQENDLDGRSYLIERYWDVLNDGGSLERISGTAHVDTVYLHAYGSAPAVPEAGTMAMAGIGVATMLSGLRFRQVSRKRK